MNAILIYDIICERSELIGFPLRSELCAAVLNTMQLLLGLTVGFGPRHPLSLARRALDADSWNLDVRIEQPRPPSAV